MITACSHGDFEPWHLAPLLLSSMWHLDFRKAFDSVNREVMWRILKARGVHPKLLALIKDLYSGSRARVTAHGTESGWFDIRTGVRQGKTPYPPFSSVLEFVCLPWSEVCSARVTSLLLLLLHSHIISYKQLQTPSVAAAAAAQAARASCMSC